MGLLWNIKDWWRSRSGARPAPTALADTVQAASHTSGGKGRGGFSSSDNALEQMADGAENFQKSLERD